MDLLEWSNSGNRAGQNASFACGSVRANSLGCHCLPKPPSTGIRSACARRLLCQPACTSTANYMRGAECGGGGRGGAAASS